MHDGFRIKFIFKFKSKSIFNDAGIEQDSGSVIMDQKTRYTSKKK